MSLGFTVVGIAGLALLDAVTPVVFTHNWVC